MKPLGRHALIAGTLVVLVLIAAHGLALRELWSHPVLPLSVLLGIAALVAIKLCLLLTHFASRSRRHRHSKGP